MAKVRARSKEWQFDVSVGWDEEKRGTVRAEGKPDLAVATPPEFRGPEGVWSPEELLVASVNSCVMTTFLYYAEKGDLSLAGYRSDAEGTVVYEDGSLRFTRIVLRPVVKIASEADREKAEEALRLGESKCLISNSLDAEVEVKAQIEVGSSES